MAPVTRVRSAVFTQIEAPPSARSGHCPSPRHSDTDAGQSSDTNVRTREDWREHLPPQIHRRVYREDGKAGDRDFMPIKTENTCKFGQVEKEFNYGYKMPNKVSYYMLLG